MAPRDDARPNPAAWHDGDIELALQPVPIERVHEAERFKLAEVASARVECGRGGSRAGDSTPLPRVRLESAAFCQLEERPRELLLAERESVMEGCVNFPAGALAKPRAQTASVGGTVISILRRSHTLLLRIGERAHCGCAEGERGERDRRRLQPLQPTIRPR